ncbi:uncharacterized protein M6B38_260970 [Iris pallida]|uniref:UFSP1/2/DUB catalytic domain-containing protein n=1 Tax=Iris pallida TaxID=29817 RepID=A0AAX6IDS8_IRIPA|nr:uncharacterized protein M6B38_260970 [Iris pallida]
MLCPSLHLNYVGQKIKNKCFLKGTRLQSMSSVCPFCHISLPFSELEWHANSHFVDEELARDMELAQEIALASPSPKTGNEQMDYVKSSDVPGRTAKTSTPSHSAADYRDLSDQEQISCLVALQTKSTFYKVKGGLITLLSRCLELERDDIRSVITGHIDHYQSTVSEDSGWGCGWRNIQMMSSHLLMQRQESRDTLFGGAGFVPDISSLQRWLEIAWERGFDALGSDSFDQKIYGSRKWIGTTECATLLRSFGLRARIVDFDSLSSSSPSMANATEVEGQSKGKRTKKEIYGPMDVFLRRKKPNDVQNCSSANETFSEKPPTLASHLKISGSKMDSDSSKTNKEKNKGHQILVDWIWTYFTGENRGKLDNMRLAVSEKTPLYFQHDGHSRTIIGIQVKKGLRGSKDKYSLLVLDPAHRTADLERSLTSNNGWQKFIKRGVHTFRKPQYQLCYIDPGVAHGEEMEQLKTIDSIYVKL